MLGKQQLTEQENCQQKYNPIKSILLFQKTIYMTKWLNAMQWFHFLAPIISIIYHDFMFWFMVIMIVCAHIHMTFLAEIYRGSTYHMSNYHWQTYSIWVIYAIYRITPTFNNRQVKDDCFCFTSWDDFYWSRIDYQNPRTLPLFIGTIILLTVNISFIVLDFYSIIQWYIFKKRSVQRTDYIRNYFKIANIPNPQIIEKSDDGRMKSIIFRKKVFNIMIV